MTTKKAGLWHYIKVFCTFFCLIASFAAAMTLTEVRTSYGGYIAFFWILGVISAILVAPGQFFRFGCKIMAVCATFGWFLLPFPLDLATVAASVAVGLAAVLASLFCIPAIFTVYTYITELRYECTDWKKDLTAALAGLAAVLAAIGLFFAMHTVTQALEVRQMDRTFDAVTVYEDYARDNANAVDCPRDALEDPVDVTEEDGGYIRIYDCSFSSHERGMYFENELQVEFEFENGEWSVVGTEHDRELVDMDPVSGTWTGEGEFWANFYPTNRYTFTLEGLTAQGGSGEMSIRLEDVIDEYSAFTVSSAAFRTYTDLNTQEEYYVLDLVLELEEPIVYSVFGSQETISSVECTYSLTQGVIATTAFDFGEMVLHAA